MRKTWRVDVRWASLGQVCIRSAVTPGVKQVSLASRSAGTPEVGQVRLVLSLSGSNTERGSGKVSLERM